MVKHDPCRAASFGRDAARAGKSREGMGEGSDIIYMDCMVGNPANPAIVMENRGARPRHGGLALHWPPTADALWLQYRTAVCARSDGLSQPLGTIPARP